MIRRSHSCGWGSMPSSLSSSSPRRFSRSNSSYIVGSARSSRRFVTAPAVGEPEKSTAAPAREEPPTPATNEVGNRGDGGRGVGKPGELGNEEEPGRSVGGQKATL